MPNRLIPLDADGLFDLDAVFLGDELKALVLQCVARNKEAVAGSGYEYAPDPAALDRVAPARLDALLGRDADIHGISSDRSISNVISFNAGHVKDDLHDAGVQALRERIDTGMAGKLREIFEGGEQLVVRASGHFWYPTQSSMGWHTNSRAPGWRIYINYAEQPGESFFRYRDPRTGDIITLEDKMWNVRVFRVTDRNPLWHCVYSNTNRFSFGYMLPEPKRKPGLLSRIRERLRPRKPLD